VVNRNFISFSGKNGHAAGDSSPLMKRGHAHSLDNGDGTRCSAHWNHPFRRARAADPELAAALKRAGQPAPVYGLPPAPRPSQSQRAEVLDDLQVEPKISSIATETQHAVPSEEELRTADDDEQDDELEQLIEIADTLKWPIPITLDLADVKSAYRYSAAEFDDLYSEFVAIPCVREFGQIQVPGVLIFAWQHEPDDFGLCLCVDFVQHEDIRVGNVQIFSPSPSNPVRGYCVDASKARYYHRSSFATEGQGAMGQFGTDLSLGLRIHASGAWPDECYVVPWETGGLDSAQQHEILSRLKTALAMLDRHLANSEAIRRYDENPYL
jgi:hypothetical protein